MKSKNKDSPKLNRDEREFLAGKVRALEKRLRISERENARLAKYIKQLQAEPDEDSETEESLDAIRKCGHNGCKSTEFHYLNLPNKRYITCKQCEHRNVERNLDTDR